MDGQSSFAMLRVGVAGLFVLVMGAQVIRSGIVAATAETQPESAALVWADHPAVLRSQAMIEVGRAAGEGAQIPSQTFARVETLARSEPLAEEPFLVRGALALQAGRPEDAERLLLSARQRNPRAPAARYLLSDFYLRSGRALEGLREMVVLARVVPNIASSLGPALAAYAQTPGAVPQLKRALQNDPGLEAALLSELAANPTNAPLILSLANNRESVDANGHPPAWQQRLLTEMVKAGQYQRAHALWRRFSPQAAGDRSGSFSRTSSGSPFEWTYHESNRGVAEPINGDLRVTYFGADDTVLASKVLTLSPGRYRLSMRAAGDVASASNVRWVMTCLQGKTQVLEQSLAAARSGVWSAAVQVPERCGAQQLELEGLADTIPVDLEITLADFQLVGSPS